LGADLCVLLCFVKLDLLYNCPMDSIMCLAHPYISLSLCLSVSCGFAIQKPKGIETPNFV